MWVYDKEMILWCVEKEASKGEYIKARDGQRDSLEKNIKSEK